MPGSLVVALLLVLAATASAQWKAVDQGVVKKLKQQCLPEHRRLDIVVSLYKEDLGKLNEYLDQLLAHPSVASREPCVIVYTKGRSPDEVAKFLQAGQIRWLPNEGREGHTYLAYLDQHYGAYAEHAMFLQGNVEEAPYVLMKMDIFTQHTGFMCLGYFGRASCDGGEFKRDVRIREVWAMTRQEFCFEDFDICYRGQFLVSAHRMMKHPHFVYKRLRTYMSLPSDHLIHKDCDRYIDPKCGYKTTDNPMLGHTMERAWTFIFNCHGLGPRFGHAHTFQAASRACDCVNGKGGQPDRQCSEEEKRGACQCVDQIAPHGRPAARKLQVVQ